MKCILTLFTLTTLLSTTTILEADTISLITGEHRTGVITKETDETITIRFDIGTISVPRDTISNIKKSSPDENKALLDSWHAEKQNAYKARLQSKKKYITKDGVPHMLHEGKWISAESFHAQQKKDKEASTLLTKEDVDRERDKIHTAQKKKVTRELTTQIIKRGKPERSTEFHDALLTHSEQWALIDMPEARIFYLDDDEDNINDRAHAEWIKNAIKKSYAHTQSLLNSSLNRQSDNRFKVIVVPEGEEPPMGKNTLRTSPNPARTFVYYNERTAEIWVYPHAAPHVDISFGIGRAITDTLFMDFVYHSLPRSHYVMPWMRTGIAYTVGSDPALLLSTNEMKQAINRNYYIKLTELLMMATAPTEEPDQTVFRTEATELVSYWVALHGRDTFSDNLISLIRLYKEHARTPENLRPEDIEDLMKEMIETTPTMARAHAGYSGFEEKWLYRLEGKK